MTKADKLTTPPVVGEMYLVPCVWGDVANILYKGQVRWWPVLLPSHEDSRYTNVKVERYWKVTESGQYLIEKCVTAPSDPKTPHHYHIDPRFTEEHWYGTDRGRAIRNLHTTIFPEEHRVEYHELVCRRVMPVQVNLYSVFGQLFVDDFTGKKMKCGRCPHKGVDLRTVPVVDGVITCPAHGMKINARTGECQL